MVVNVVCVIGLEICSLVFVCVMFGFRWFGGLCLPFKLIVITFVLYSW